MIEYSFYFVCTPIGNLEDLSFRAKRILSTVDFILAEDTRKTRKILSHYGIDIPLKSYHDHNKVKVTPHIIELIKKGKRVALVSDAGTPLVSDPGYYILRKLVENDISFTVIPGPTAITTALVLSGMPSDRFAFLGYVPRKRGQRKKFLEEIREFRYTVIVFETPHRIEKTLNEIVEIMPDREIAIAREMTKLHEETIRGMAKEVLLRIQGKRIRGEITLVIRGSG